MGHPAAKGIRVGIAVFAGLITVLLLGFTFLAGFAILLTLFFLGIARNTWRNIRMKFRNQRDNVRYYVPEGK